MLKIEYKNSFPNEYGNILVPIIKKELNKCENKYFFDDISDLDQFLNDLLTVNVFENLNEYKLINDYIEVSKLYTKCFDEVKKKKSTKKKIIVKNGCNENVLLNKLLEYDFLFVGYSGNKPKINKVDIYSTSYISTSLSKIGNHIFQMKEFVYKIFDYDKYIVRPIGENVPWRYKIIDNIGIEVCPYCGRNYISKYSKDNSDNFDSTDGELDHFYSKTKYPLFKLSLFNLIPSCKSCNHIKSNSDEKYFLNPYFESFGDDATFKLDFNYNVESKTIYNNYQAKVILDIKATSKNGDKIKNYNKKLHLTETYNSHQHTINKLIIDSSIYSNKMIKLYTKYCKSYNENMTEEDVKAKFFDYSIDDKNDSLISMSKFKRDIVKQLTEKKKK